MKPGSVSHLERSPLYFDLPLPGNLYYRLQPDAEGHERMLNGVELKNQKAAGRVLLVSAHC
jgi:hypothetical protein